MVDRGHRVERLAFSDGYDAGVDEAQVEVGVGDDQLGAA